MPTRLPVCWMYATIVDADACALLTAKLHYMLSMRVPFTLPEVMRERRYLPYFIPTDTKERAVPQLSVSINHAGLSSFGAHISEPRRRATDVPHGGISAPSLYLLIGLLFRNQTSGSQYFYTVLFINGTRYLKTIYYY